MPTVSPPPVPVVVDARERCAGLADALRGRWPRVVEGTLEVGDVLVGSRVIVERKTREDLAVSLRDGRLFRQAYALVRDAERPLVVIEGAANPEHPESDPLSEGAYRTVVLMLVTGYGIPVLRTRDVRQSAALLAAIAARESRREWRWRARLPARDRGGPADGDALRILEALPGVGPARARALLRAFGSVAGVMAASEAALASVPGCGAVFAAGLVRALRIPADGRADAGAESVHDPVAAFGAPPPRRAILSRRDGLSFTA